MRISAICVLLVVGSLVDSIGAAAVDLPDAVTAAAPFAPSRNQGTFLALSDIHFDPYADPAVVPQLVTAPVERWPAIFGSSGAYAQYGSDTNYPLMASTLSAAKNLGLFYDYVLVTGDLLSHDFKAGFDRYAGGDEKAYEGFVIKTMAFVTQTLQQSFDGVPVILALGNNDSACGDYMLTPNSAMLHAVAQDLAVLAGNAQATEDFKTGGFYAVPHPTVPGRQLVVLDDVFWSSQYLNRCDPVGGDPGAAELGWLEWTLFKARSAKQTVSLVMHIPPGMDAYYSAQGTGDCRASATSAWQGSYTARFLALVNAYRDVLGDSYAGHTHMDDFRVLTDSAGRPFLTTRITPAVSPIFRNNPAFSVMLYDKTDGSVADYATLYLANLGELKGSVAARWSNEYTFRRAYGYPRYGPAELMSLAGAVRSDESVRNLFMRFFAARTADRSPITLQNWQAYACAQTELTPDAFADCYCGASAAPAGRDATPAR